MDFEEGGSLGSGEVAKLAGVSKDTLRHYERIGVLPNVQRTDSRYRRYAADSVRRVLIVRAALELGFSLSELAEIFALRDSGQAPCDDVRRIAIKRLAAVEKQIESLITLRDHLKTLLQAWDGRLAGRKPGELAHLLETLIPAPPAHLSKQKETP